MKDLPLGGFWSGFLIRATLNLPKPETSEHKSMGISSLRKNIVRAIICDHCRKTVQVSFFQCNICHAGDDDICL